MTDKLKSKALKQAWKNGEAVYRRYDAVVEAKTNISHTDRRTPSEKGLDVLFSGNWGYEEIR